MIDRELIGREYGPVRYEIGRQKIAEFATAVGETDPVFYSKAAAVSCGYDEQIAPFTFPTVVTNISDQLLRQDSELDFDWERVVDGEEEIAYQRYIRAGDLLEATPRIRDVDTKGKLEFLVVDTELVEVRAGATVCTVRATLIERSD